MILLQKKSSFLYTFILILIFSVQIGCAIQQPIVTVQNVSIKDLSLKKVDLVFDLDVENPNNVSFKLFSFDYNILLNGLPTLEGNQELGQTIKASDHTIIQVPLTINLMSIYKNALSMLSKPKDPAYKATFQLYFDLPVLGRKKIPVSKEGTIPISSGLK